MFSGFAVNEDGDYGNDLYLLELQAAHIDIVVGGALAPHIYLHSFIPPQYANYWSDINVSRVGGGMGGLPDIDSNWIY
jgi:hypothetical protein